MERGSPRLPPKTHLLAQSQLFDESAVTLNIFALEVVQQVAALADELEQATAGVEVLLVFLEVPGEAFNAGGKQSYLDFRGTGVAFMLGVSFDNSLFLGGVHNHSDILRMGCVSSKVP